MEDQLKKPTKKEWKEGKRGRENVALNKFHL